MMRWNRFLDILIELYYACVGMLCLLVLGYSIATRVVWRQHVANDLFDVLPERIPILVIGVLVSLFVMYCMWTRIRHHRWIYIALAWAFLLSLFCVLSVRGLAVNDGEFLDACINQFMEGDYSALYNGYLVTYPFQIGYVMFGQILYLVCGPSNFLVYEFLNIGSILLTVWFLHRMAYEMWEQEDLADLTAILSLGAVMLYAYATLVYNDIWSLAPQMAAVYLTMRYIRTRSRRAMAGGVATIAVACVLKTNCYIALIAMVLSLLLAGFREMAGIHHHDTATSEPQEMAADAASCGHLRTRYGSKALAGKVLWAALAVMVTMGAIKAVNAGYAAAAGLDQMPDGVPSMAYYAMGMHQVVDDGCVKYGWYDGSNVGFLSEGGNDAVLASAYAMEDIKESALEFAATPKYLVKFYLLKFLQQWGDGTCSSMRQMEMTGRNVEPRSVMAEALMYGTLGDVLLEIMNVFHTILYLGAVLYFAAIFRQLWARRRAGHGDDSDADGNITAAIPVISTNEAFLVMFVLGGMLFHEIWEASSRYVIRYYLSLIPIAAYGYGWVFERIRAVRRYSSHK